ncbi:hypothetical protein [Paracidobacterium acidisoli]|uniref:Uncharacterized protein n=1 Tax=Paracidobacterium acidisoli TaxID=2303751 RepID=A0A372IP44_9BACT|nr:hypothetical protein [Paracidobacterium acidisoli]MBT9330968.1 hypothetical protein [Paracidobacterium acidisoli]
MNQNPNLSGNGTSSTAESYPDTAFDRRIDAALRTLDSVTPSPGLEDRILIRLSARSASRPARTSFFRIGTPIFAFCGAAFACALIVVGTVSYSHHSHPAMPGAMQTGTSGIGAASAMHRLAPQPLAPAPEGHGRSHRNAANPVQKPGHQKATADGTGKASVAPDAGAQK